MLAACGGGGDGGTPPVTPGFTVSLSSTSLSVEQGGMGTVTATIARTGTFAGTVNLTTESVPTGITASFSPAAITSGTTSTTLTVTAATTVTPGPYTFTVRGQAAGVADQRTATVSMTVTARPAIAIATAPASASVLQGGTGSFAATITRTNFTGPVTVAVTGAPAGVTTAVTAAGDVHTVAITVGAATAPGSYTLTSTATGAGVTTVSATFALTVSVPAASITLAAAPSALTVQAGASGLSTTITITRTNFTGAVSLGVLSGAPTGVTTSIVSSPTTTNSMVVTFAAGAATVPGTYPIVLQGSGTGVDNATVPVSLTVTAAAAGSIALSTNPTAVSAVAGGAGVNMAINITRTGFAGAVTLAATGAPTGVGITFATSPTTGSALTATFTAILTTVPGTYPITLTGSGTGISDATVQVSLTVTAPPSVALSLSVNPVVVMQGASGSTTINIARNNFTSAVALSAPGLPAGITASFNTQTTTTNSSILTLTVAAIVTTGSYPITVNATGFGIATATVVVNLTVTQASSGGNVAFAFCGAAGNIPIWFAAQNGVSGAWTQVAVGANNSYTFNVAGLGGAAWVTQNGVSDFDLTIAYGSQSELAAQGQSHCVSPVFKTVTGSASGFGLTNSDFVSVSLGTASASPPPTFATPNFTIANVPDGLRDLVGTRNGFDIANPLAGFVLNKLFLTRGLNPANGSSVGVVDFNSSTDAFDPVAQTLTVNGPAVGETVSSNVSFITSNGSFASLGASTTTAAASSPVLNFFAVPAARTVAGDVNSVFALSATMSGNAIIAARAVTASFRNAANQSVTLGAVVSTPTVTTLTSTPYVRLRTQLARQPDYQDYWTFNYSQSAGGVVRSVVTQLSATYQGSASTVDLSVPDFTLVGGWQNTWGLQQSTSISHSATAIGWVTGGGAQTDGALTRFALRNVTIP